VYDFLENIKMKSLPIFAGLSAAILLLTGCGGSGSSSTTTTGDEHAHSALISQINSDALSVLEEGEAENLETAASANGATLLLADNGEAAAIITTGAVQFVAAHHEEEAGAHEEEHELPEVSTLSITGAGLKVINTNGHFSVLADSATQLVPFESLEEGATPEAQALTLGITEVYPALLLEEGDELISVAFNGTDAVIYEDTTATADTKTCVTVNSTAQNSEFALVSCDNASFSVKLEEGVSDHTIEIADIANVSTSVEWLTRADVFVGLGADDKFYVVEENATEELELEGSAFAAPANMCAWGIDSASADIFALTASALTVYNHEGEVQDTITLDSASTCANLKMATASQAVFVIDNASQTLYEIDKEAVSYHIHGREDVSVNDVASVVSFHELEEGDHDHSH
jgi:hypothetical protein